MNPLVFPVTFLDQTLLHILSLFFSRVTVLLPAEKIFEVVGSREELPIAITEETPVLLGDRLDDFQATIKALQNWGAGIGLDGRLSAQALLQLEQSTLEMPYNIISAIKGVGDDGFMQALLLLGLAHEKDRGDAEINMDIATLEQKQGLLRFVLDGVSETDDQGFGNLHSPWHCPENIPARLKPWALLASRMQANGVVPLGIGLELKDRLDVACDAENAGHQDIMCLQIPEQAGADTGWRAFFIDSLEKALNQFGLTGSGLSQLLETTRALQSEWEQRFGAVKASNTLYLTVYDLPAYRLLSRITGIRSFNDSSAVFSGRVVFFIT